MGAIPDYDSLNIIVPEQTWMSGATSRQDPALREKRLMAAILEDHLRCLLKSPVAPAGDSRERIAQQEIKWLYTDGIWYDEKRGVSSDYVFGVLGLNKKELIKYLEDNNLVEVLMLAKQLKKQWLKRAKQRKN